MYFPSVITVLGLAAALGSAAAVVVPATARHVEPPAGDDDAFLITRAFLTSPSARPGSYQYCSISVNITDPSTQSTTRCEAEYGPCSRNSVDPPSPPRPLNDTSHAASCAPTPPTNSTTTLFDQDDPFLFYFDAYGGIYNYSIQVSRSGRTGSTGLINRDVYGGALRYQCGGSGFCSSFIGSGTIIRAPFDAD